MRIAILSDIHANLAALTAVLAEAGRLGADRIHSLGDIVGYGPDPAACVALVQQRAAVSLTGNHDAATAGLTPAEDFNEYARWAVAWTASVLSPEERAYLGSLPYTFSADGSLAVHASPYEPARWHYIHGIVDAREHFEHFREQVCFLGHTHRPFILVEESPGRLAHGGEIVQLRQGCRYLVNVGSVGQPRDRDPRAGFALHDTATGEISLRRVAYPVGETQERMRAVGAPAFLVDRLAAGF
jgi:diadenosine tetraphosphatase ApaH/serine/threonine PP2A family protein phosphatase